MKSSRFLLCAMAAVVTCILCMLSFSHALNLPWSQVDYDDLGSRRAPISSKHEDYVSNLGLHIDYYNILNDKTLIYHSGLNRFLITKSEVLTAPNRRFVYPTSLHIIDPDTGKIEQSPVVFEPRKYTIVQNALLSSKGFLYIPVFDYKTGSNSVLKINTKDWTSTTFPTVGYPLVPAVIDELSKCYIYLSDSFMTCLDLDNPSRLKWKLSLPEESYALSKILVAIENNQPIVYVNLYSTILKIDPKNTGSIVKTVPFANQTVASIAHTGIGSFLTFTLATQSETSFGVIDMKSGNFKTTTHVGITWAFLQTSISYLDHSIGHSHILKTVVYSSDRKTSNKGIHVYTTIIHEGEDSLIVKPFSFSSLDIKSIFPLPSASNTKDNSKVVMYVQRLENDNIDGEYCLFDVHKGHTNACRKSIVGGGGIPYQMLGADNGKVYNILTLNNTATMESVSF